MILMVFEQTVDELFEKGYRQVSRRYRRLARVDVDDVREFFENNGYANIASLPYPDREDQYRRCYSRDIIEVPEEEMSKVRSLTSQIMSH